MSLTSFDDFDSIAESCFLILPAARGSQPSPARKRKAKQQQKSSMAKRRGMEESATMDNDGFQTLISGMEPAGCMALRQNAFRALWDRSETIMDDILLGLNDSVRASIRDFVDMADRPSAQRLISMPYHEIPTALVSAGINVPDHDAQFSSIADTLITRSDDAPMGHFVARLASRACGSLTAMMTSMMDQLLAQHEISNKSRRGASNSATAAETAENDTDDDALDEDDEESGISYQLSALMTKPIKISSHDLQMLTGWYKHVVQNIADKSQWPRIVIILQDFEAFDSQVLDDFVTIMSQYRQQLPIQLIIGVATSIEILHQSLTKTTISLLRIEKFRLQKSTIWFGKALAQLFMDGISGLKFGPRPFKFLLDQFYLTDYSVRKVKASIKYAYMHHYYTNPLSIFLELFDEEEPVQRLISWHKQGLTSAHHASHLRMLWSFRRRVERLVDDKEILLAARLLEDDEFLLTEQLSAWIQELHAYHRAFRLAMATIGFLQRQAPTSRLAELSKLQLYQDILENPQWHEDDDGLLKHIRTFIHRLDADAIRPFLVSLAQFLANDVDDIDCDERKEWSSQVKRWISDLDAVTMTKAADDENDTATDDTNTSTSVTKMPENKALALQADVTRQTKTAAKSQEKAIDHLKQKGSFTSRLLIDMANWLQHVLAHCLRSYTTLPMYELVYYPHVNMHERAFTPNPSASIHTALTQAQYYLNCTCCLQHPDQSLKPTEQDTNLIYESYLECNRLINLFDLFTAFSEKVSREPRPKKHPLEKNEIQARFIRSVAELQFLGFIKPTQRKTDHVLRLTWSAQ